MPVRRSKAATQLSCLVSAPGAAVLAEKLGKPILQMQQRPDQQTAVFAALEMIVDHPQDGVTIEHLPDARPVAIEHAAHIVDAFALEPARIRRRKPLLFALC